MASSNIVNNYNFFFVIYFMATAGVSHSCVKLPFNDWWLMIRQIWKEVLGLTIPAFDWREITEKTSYN
jgi:hypothetical protein